MSDLIDDIIVVKEKSMLAISAAEEALAAIGGDDVRVMLPNVWNSTNQMGRYEIVGVGRRIKRDWLFFNPRPETVFYKRADWYRHGVYVYSTLKEFSTSELVERLQKNGAWGAFYRDNPRMVEYLRRACVEGFSKPSTSEITLNGD